MQPIRALRVVSLLLAAVCGLFTAEASAVSGPSSAAQALAQSLRDRAPAPTLWQSLFDFDQHLEQLVQGGSIEAALDDIAQVAPAARAFLAEDIAGERSFEMDEVTEAAARWTRLVDLVQGKIKPVELLVMRPSVEGKALLARIIHERGWGSAGARHHRSRRERDGAPGASARPPHE